ncbi:unnamed protein product [Closterium sp. Naga37s-1]|nr:unnamed protein product [Closterium sp. Naga37s-1]
MGGGCAVDTQDIANVSRCRVGAGGKVDIAKVEVGAELLRVAAEQDGCDSEWRNVMGRTATAAFLFSFLSPYPPPLHRTFVSYTHVFPTHLRPRISHQRRRTAPQIAIRSLPIPLSQPPSSSPLRTCFSSNPLVRLALRWRRIVVTPFLSPSLPTSPNSSHVFPLAFPPEPPMPTSACPTDFCPYSGASLLTHVLSRPLPFPLPPTLLHLLTSSALHLLFLRRFLTLKCPALQHSSAPASPTLKTVPPTPTPMAQAHCSLGQRLLTRRSQDGAAVCPVAVLFLRDEQRAKEVRGERAWADYGFFVGSRPTTPSPWLRPSTLLIPSVYFYSPPHTLFFFPFPRLIPHLFLYPYPLPSPYSLPAPYPLHLPPTQTSLILFTFPSFPIPFPSPTPHPPTAPPLLPPPPSPPLPAQHLHIPRQRLPHGSLPLLWHHTPHPFALLFSPPPTLQPSSLQLLAAPVHPHSSTAEAADVAKAAGEDGRGCWVSRGRIFPENKQREEVRDEKYACKLWVTWSAAGKAGRVAG